MTPTYCPHPWVGINYIPNYITPCIFWKGAAVDIEHVRSEMLKGNKLAGCEQCYAAEQHGALSGRQEAIRDFGHPTEPTLKYLAINFDNLCNLKCRGCATTSSHLWQDDEIAIYGASFLDTKYITTEFQADYSHLTHIKISGGEAFLSKRADKFFADLKKQDVLKNIDLGISSNGTTLPSPEAVIAMTESKNCTLSISVDGIGPLNDYFRSGSNFDKLVENLHYFKSLGIAIRMHTTVSIYNVNMLQEIEDFFELNFPEFDRGHRVLLWPQQLSVQHMPDDLKAQVQPIVESYGDKYSDVLEALNSTTDNLFGHFLNFHNKLDSLRNESLGDSNRLLANYIASNNTQIESKMFFASQREMLLS